MATCGHVEGDMVCINEAGHRGRHKLRPMPGPIEKAPEMEVHTSSGADIGVVDIELPKITESHGPPIVEEWLPDAGDFISLKGKAYLPARRRIQWMRGIPKPHPEWTIDTEIVEHTAGSLTKPGPVGVGRVEKGFAVVRANIFDDMGRLIATGLKSEYSENFTDYLEKAETGAIARALAVAGYGTESAIDLDEGVDAGRIADAPIEAPARAISGRSVELGPSKVPGVGRGGKTDGASVAQIRRVAALSRELELSAEALVAILTEIFGSGPTLGTDETANSGAIATFLADQSSALVGKLIETLDAAVSRAET